MVQCIYIYIHMCRCLFSLVYKMGSLMDCDVCNDMLEDVAGGKQPRFDIIVL